jgi:hypothetical protein
MCNIVEYWKQLGQAERIVCVCVAVGIVPYIFFTTRIFVVKNKARRAIQAINKLNEHSMHPLKSGS